MKLYNTLTRKIEKFVPYNKDYVTFYTCGPTVYHYAHIGNIRNYIGHDILEKTLKYLGYNVKRVMNITDVGHLTSDSDSGEDKMAVASKRENKTADEIADFYSKAFFEDFKAVNCNMPEVVTKATDNIDEYIKIIEKLIMKDYAYVSDGNVYFDISKLIDYYVLTNHKEDEMVVGVRDGVEKDPLKRNQADFALWFTKSKFENHEQLWDSPWGKGYPGWHIECTGISIKYLGEYLDIHGGGVDNIFPHHTNEIAQSEAYLGHQWCKYWFHNEHLMDETGKMSKSKGAILTVSELIKQKYDPIAFRFMCLCSHYRKQLVFSFDSLKQAQDTLYKLKKRISLLKDDGKLNEVKLKEYDDKFSLCIADDLNTSNAITTLYDLLKDDTVNEKTKIFLIKKYDTVLSLDLFNMNLEIDSDLEEYINKKILERNDAKKNRDFVLADKIRDELLEKNIKLLDTREGTKYELIK